MFLYQYKYIILPSCKKNKTGIYLNTHLCGVNLKGNTTGTKGGVRPEEELRALSYSCVADAFRRAHDLSIENCS